MLIDLKKVEDKKNVFKFKIDKNDFEEAIQEVFLEKRDKYKITGMTTGMIPKYLIEEYYGEEVFYEDTVKYLIEKEFKFMNDTYKKYQIQKENIYDIKINQIGKDKDLIFELLINN